MKRLLPIISTLGALLLPLAARAQWPPTLVANALVQGIRNLHGDRATPRVRINIPEGRPTPCGPAQTMYCLRNHTVYVGRHMTREAYRYGDAAYAYIIAHEYGHAMQAAFRFMPRDRTHAELQADCLAGVYLAAVPNLTFDDQDLGEILSFSHSIGDYATHLRDHHGTPQERVMAVSQGLHGGVSACRAGYFFNTFNG